MLVPGGSVLLVDVSLAQTTAGEKSTVLKMSARVQLVKGAKQHRTPRIRWILEAQSQILIHLGKVSESRDHGLPLQGLTFGPIAIQEKSSLLCKTTTPWYHRRIRATVCTLMAEQAREMLRHSRGEEGIWGR